MTSPPSYDFEARAADLLPDHVRAYFATAAGSGVGSHEGVAAWSSLRFRPRVLRDVSHIDVSTTVLGTTVQTPVLIAPMAQQLGAHAEGEAAMGRGAAASGSLLGVSTNTAVAFADINGGGMPWWYQVYVTRSHALTEMLVGRAVANGARALMLTVDMTRCCPRTSIPPAGPMVRRRPG